MKRYHQLTSEEEEIITSCATEYPGSGKYLDHFETGIYLCKRCDKPLFHSEDKFISHCGWPSFDDEIKDAIFKQIDDDGRRIEILCSHCHGHLGHLFEKERLTKKNRRYCVNSLALRFNPMYTSSSELRAIFAGGCFWGIEYWLKKTLGVLKAESGYIGGFVVNPTYEEVCSDLTGHAEAVEVIFNPKVTSYATLCKKFLQIHDFTQLNQQGPDIGSQYRSEIFYLSLEQKTIAEEIIGLIQAKGFNIKTAISPASWFYPAELYHQNYYEKKGLIPSCHSNINISEI